LNVDAKVETRCVGDPFDNYQFVRRADHARDEPGNGEADRQSNAAHGIFHEITSKVKDKLWRGLFRGVDFVVIDYSLGVRSEVVLRQKRGNLDSFIRSYNSFFLCALQGRFDSDG
jgi:hypothetical protein